MTINFQCTVLIIVISLLSPHPQISKDKAKIKIDKAKIFTKPQHIFTKHVKLHLNNNKLIKYIVVKHTLFVVTINK